MKIANSQEFANLTTLHEDHLFDTNNIEEVDQDATHDIDYECHEEMDLEEMNEAFDSTALYDGCSMNIAAAVCLLMSLFVKFKWTRECLSEL